MNFLTYHNIYLFVRVHMMEMYQYVEYVKQNQQDLINILVNKKSEFMDPRPYHFEYRRPRPYNPTFQSSNLYESIFTLNLINKNKNQQSMRTSSITQLKRVNSMDLSNKKSMDQRGNSDRYEDKKIDFDANNCSSINRSRVANYGMNLVRNTSMDQSEVYKKQEKNFNIISYYPKSYEPNLKKYPRLTLQDRLIQFDNKNPQKN